MKKQTNIKIVELNNKSRQGTYIYIKEQGKRPSYYKYNPEYKIDYYLNYYKSKEKLENKRRGTSVTKHLKTYKAVETGEPVTLKKKEKVRSDAERYLRKVKKQYGGRDLERLLKKGIQAIVINDTFRTTPSVVFKANQKLIGDIVLDKKIKELMAQEENMKKLSNRLEQRIKLVGENGLVLSEFNVVGKTTQQVTSDMNSVFHKGDEWGKTKGNNKLATLQTMGYNKPTTQQEGKIQRIQITTILRKAK